MRDMPVRATVTHLLVRVQISRMRPAGRVLDDCGSSLFPRGIAVSDHAVAVELPAQYTHAVQRREHPVWIRLRPAIARERDGPVRGRLE